MNKRVYPPNWKEIRTAIKERAGWKCETCGLEEGTLQVSRHTGNRYIVYLHAAHLDADPTNAAARLAALCPSCHMKYDRHEELTERPSARRRGYSLTTTDKLIDALHVAGLTLTETPSGYRWNVDDLSGKSSNAITAVSDAIYHLRQSRKARSKKGGAV